MNKLYVINYYDISRTDQSKLPKIGISISRVLEENCNGFVVYKFTNAERMILYKETRTTSN